MKSLRAALARYARTEVEVKIDDQNDHNNGTLPYNDLNKLQTDYAKSLDACIQHISNLGFDLQELIESTGFDKIAALDSAVNAVCTNDESRARFYVFLFLIICGVMKQAYLMMPMIIVM